MNNNNKKIWEQKLISFNFDPQPLHFFCAVAQDITLLGYSACWHLGYGH